MAKKSWRRKVEEQRERRLWLTQVIFPLVGVATFIYIIPEYRQGVIDGAKKVQKFIGDKIDDIKKNFEPKRTQIGGK